MSAWLILDCGYLCHRALFAMGHMLNHNNEPTGMLFAFFRDLEAFKTEHATNRVAFCFDSKNSRRREVYEPYKATRRDVELTEEELLVWENFHKQVVRLRREYLPRMGYRNILYQNGYEADDHIAAACQGLRKKHRGIIVGSDNDLLQLLSPRVCIYHPHRKAIYTAHHFRSEYGIEPSQWADVKAIAGCSSDNVEGIRGIGEKTAAKFISGRLKPDSAASKKIVEGDEIWKRNLPLVALPYEGTSPVRLREDEVNKREVRLVYNELGIRRLGV